MNLPLIDLLPLLLFVLPAYLANAVPLLFGGGQTIDLNKNFVDGRPWFGKSKTIRGFISGVLAGVLTGLILSFLLPDLFIIGLSFSEKIIVSFLLGLGAMLGDLLGSFLKRRLGVTPGESIFLLDQLLFIVVALLLSSLFYTGLWDFIDSRSVLFLLVLTYIVHLSANIFAHKIKLKKVPW
ncbi:MAG: CDP-2,3-bis-(O-geranylgeranyl)-sn-glycerol synthase [Candidatus Micrarchaeota archaeon]